MMHPMAADQNGNGSQMTTAIRNAKIWPQNQRYLTRRCPALRNLAFRRESRLHAPTLTFGSSKPSNSDPAITQVELLMNAMSITGQPKGIATHAMSPITQR